MRLWLLLCALLAPTRALKLPNGVRAGGVAKNETGCGESGTACCQVQLGPETIQAVCNRRGLYCSPGERCLQVPSDCGQQGAACCPGNAGVDYCSVPDTVCLPANATAAADNEIGADNPVCHSFDLSTCGQSGGLCSGAPGGWLPPPTLQCPAAQRGCPEGCYCWRPTADTLGVCNPLPPNCGGTDPKNVTNYYCNRDAANPSYYCTGMIGTAGAGVCRRWLEYPSECGAPGKPCCNSTYRSWMDGPKAPWPICDKGAYCGSAGNTAASVCIENAEGCGQEGKGCCVTTVPATTIYWCQAGFYCPQEAGAQDPTCQRCPPPQQAQQGIFECTQSALDSKAAGLWT